MATNQLPATKAVRLHASDNVLIASQAMHAGEEIASENVRATAAIPVGHKIANVAIPAGQSVLKYGQVIGVATQDISVGDHVHVHNLAASSLRLPAKSVALMPPQEAPRTFRGYRRANGQVGVRNYVGVFTSVNCSATVVRMICDSAARSGLLAQYPHVDGVVPIAHTSGCGMAGEGEGFDLLRRTMRGTAANPNFGAVMLVGLGCEVVQVEKFADDFGLGDQENFQFFTIQDAGGTRASVDEGLKRLTVLLEIANRARRTEAPASEIVLGLQCGGSDGWSGVTSNPALGNASDRLVALGGTVMLSETPEIYGAEHILYARAISGEVANQLRVRLDWWEKYTAMHGAKMQDNPSPGNLAGGLTTILEKSLGAVSKGGTTQLVDVIGYAESLRSRGLVFMDSPGFDPCSATGQVASGANLIAFTTGRGSAFGCKPSPSIKLSSNTEIFRRMRDDIDINCGDIADGSATIASKGAEILTYLLQVASGSPSKSEALGYGGAEFVPWLIGATM